MKPYPNSQVFDWIQNARMQLQSPAAPQLRQCRVRNLIPAQFERYAKILHRLESHYDNIDYPLTKREIAITAIPDCTAVKEFVQRKRTTSASSRFRWKEIAEWLNVPFKPEINHQWFVERLRPSPECWPRYIYGPDDGNLAPDERKELASVLTEFTRLQDCFFRFAEIPFIATDTPLLFHGSLHELDNFLLPYQFTPEYWWPADESWCVCSDYDLAFTVVGGCSQLIDALLLNKVLETLEVTVDTRVDSLVPIPARTG